MKFNYSFLVSIAILSMIFGCGKLHTSDKQLNDEVNAFATSYFNYDFHGALSHCTPESRKWIVYAASNIHDADIDVLRNAKEGASVEIKDYVFDDNDSTGYALVTVNNYMRMDTIGKACQLISKSDFRLPIVMRNNKWTIKMEGLPRSERQSHD
jgi:hypothetical protein